MQKKYRVAGYVKLAQKWEKREKQAVEYNNAYYEEKFKNTQFELVGVYIDITGKKEICKREHMMKLLKRCYRGEIDCIAAQTRAFLAANHKEFCYLIFFLFSLPFHIDIITEDEDYNIDTIHDYDDQSKELYKWAYEYISLNEDDYLNWKKTIIDYVCDIK